MTIDTSAYQDMKKAHQDEFNAFSKEWCFYAFSDEQFAEGFKRLADRGLITTDDDLRRFTMGGFIVKGKVPELVSMTKRHEAELLEAMKGYDFALGAFKYEADNHEFCINWQADWDTVQCFYDVEFREGANGIDYLRDAGACEDTIQAYKDAIRAHFAMADEQGWY